jgi:hypothetical protein
VKRRRNTILIDGSQSCHIQVRRRLYFLVKWIADAKSIVVFCNTQSTLFSAISKNTTMPAGIKRSSDMKKGARSF